LRPNSLPNCRYVTSLLLVALILSACQFAPQVDSVTETAVAKSATPAPISTITPTLALSLTPTFPADVLRLKGLKLPIWHVWMGELESALETEVTEFNQTNAWGLKMELKAFGGAAALQDALQAASPAERPALLLASPEQLITLKAGTLTLLDLTTLIQDSEWGLTAAETDDFLPGLWPPETSEGETLGLPILNNVRLIIYNRTWAQELGFSKPPATPQEFEEQVCSAMRANLSEVYTMRGSGGWLLDNDAYTLLGWLQGFGSDYSKEYVFNTSQGIAAFTYLQALVDEDCTYRLAVANSEPYETFASHRALAYSGNLVDLPMQEQVSNKLKSTDRWEVIPFPSLDGEGVLPTFSQDVAIVDGSHEQELGAWLFVRWLLLSRNQAGLAQKGGLLPVTQSGLEALQKLNPLGVQQKSLLNLDAAFVPVRGDSSWSIARRVLEDAAWQLYQPYTKAENIPGILEQLDAMVKELEGK
jgi:multiple sugar transport system substrate-binding protein